MPSVITLARMELNGFGVSQEEFATQQHIMTEKLNLMEQHAYRFVSEFCHDALKCYIFCYITLFCYIDRKHISF